MIYFFSGTGNSLHVARHLADALGEELCPMAPFQLSPVGATGVFRGATECSSGSTKGSESPFATEEGRGAIGLVFPVYAWGIPNVVEQFVRNYKASLLGGRLEGGFFYAVLTCGDDMGYADEVLEKALGRKLDAVFSVQMPNTYVCLPGFDVDSSEVCQAKYAKEEVDVKEIAACVKERKSVRRLKRGLFPWTKTYVIRPLFNRYLLTDKYFHVDASRCISCGKCKKACLVENIIISTPPKGNCLLAAEQLGSESDGGQKRGGGFEVPHWQSHCAGCLACYHTCPHHAINFGKMTQKKGQYSLP